MTIFTLTNSKPINQLISFYPELTVESTNPPERPITYSPILVRPCPSPARRSVSNP